jgi:hypothetical protein
MRHPKRSSDAGVSVEVDLLVRVRQPIGDLLRFPREISINRGSGKAAALAIPPSLDDLRFPDRSEGVGHDRVGVRRLYPARGKLDVQLGR